MLKRKQLALTKTAYRSKKNAKYMGCCELVLCVYGGVICRVVGIGAEWDQRRGERITQEPDKNSSSPPFCDDTKIRHATKCGHSSKL